MLRNPSRKFTFVAIGGLIALIVAGTATALASRAPMAAGFSVSTSSTAPQSVAAQIMRDSALQSAKIQRAPDAASIASALRAPASTAAETTEHRALAPRPNSVASSSASGSTARVNQPARVAPPAAPSAPAAAAVIASPEPSETPEPTETPEAEHPAEVSFQGSIESMTGVSPTLTLVINGQTVNTDGQTKFEGILAVGVWLEVEGFAQPDGSVLAKEIKVEHNENEDVAEIEFQGPIQSLPATPYFGDWVIDGRTVTVDMTTTLDTSQGMPAVGAIAEVKAIQKADGTLLAIRIKIEDAHGFENEAEFKGTISDLTGTNPYTMTVNGHTVTTDGSTQIEGVLANGAFVEVHGLVQPDGSVLATEIKVEDNAEQANEKEFKSTIATLPAGGFIGTWTFSNGESVTVDASTVIDESRGPAVVGALAEVKALKQADGTWLAVRIQIEND